MQSVGAPDDVVSRQHARLIAQASLEITAHETGAAAALAEHLPRGARVHVTYLANSPYVETVKQAKALAAAGLEPAPHLAARSLASQAELDDYLARIVGEAGATSVLLVAGDLPRARGPYSASLDLMRTGLLQARGIRTIILAAHPEAHPTVAADIMERALTDKLAYAAENGLAAELVTQFCFEAQPVLECVARLRKAGINAPMRIGAAAPTDAARLMKFALRCGIGPSLRALQHQAGRLGQLAGTAGPEALIADLARGLAARDLDGVDGMHFFVFGGAARAAVWLQELRRATGASGGVER